ncbi:MAG: TRAP transporter small permease subunit [Pseudomonadales bacterium]|jgi:TRAP-type mannitol/chloroaromatic compound transport system permease small subunit|nr:TRAP transporter small permease subunit [Pseudomonadales bacterium]MDA0762191.1 TRAP transporter small permease subunit [Pseudomonadota bacterium]MDA0958717.1 TRAP transporter small permease subunit [Pseudomonadota bacterium]MDA1207364.1 TRAP transporter small permease subunit [Pseudomonadota bacterium]
MAEVLPETGLSIAIDRFIRRLGKWLGLIWLALIAVIMVNVICRYLFAEGFIELEELQWHLYASGFLLGLSYALVEDAHVRVDVFRSRWQASTTAWVELYGLVFLLFPFCLLVIVSSLPFVLYAFETSEVSQAPGGLPLRWLIKAMLPLGFLLLVAAGISRLTRVFAELFGSQSPRRRHD